MTKTREYLVNKAMGIGDAEAIPDERGVAEALFVMYDAGLLDVTEDDSDEPLFAIAENATEDELEAAEIAFNALGACCDDARTSYLSGETH